MAMYQTLSWHGIPTGVKAKDADEEKRETLPIRFQAAVDAAATATGNIGTQAYLAGWQWSQPEEREGTAVQVVRTISAEIEDTFNAEKVKSLRQEIEARLKAT